MLRYFDRFLEKPEVTEPRLTQVAVPQLKEILTGYGEFPAVLWFDTPSDINRDRAAKLAAVLKLKPGIIINNRLGAGYRGDTETPEQTIPATGFKDRDWETCMTMNDTWGFKSNDLHWKSTETLLHNLIDIASKGGNYLLNVGPTAEGLIPQPSVERLQEVGRWMKVNGEAIYATTASPCAQPSWGRITTKAAGDVTTLYLHVFNWPASGEEAVISGGSRLQLAWTPYRDGIMRVRVPAGLDTDQLFVNGRRQQMAM